MAGVTKLLGHASGRCSISGGCYRASVLLATVCGLLGRGMYAMFISSMGIRQPTLTLN